MAKPPAKYFIVGRRIPKAGHNQKLSSVGVDNFGSFSQMVKGFDKRWFGRSSTPFALAQPVAHATRLPLKCDIGIEYFGTKTVNYRESFELLLSRLSQVSEHWTSVVRGQRRS